MGPRWDLLDHDGFIVSRFLPDGLTPCPYLQPGSLVRVLIRRSSALRVSPAVFGLAAKPQLVRSASSSSAFGFSVPHSEVFIGDTSLPLDDTDVLIQEGFRSVGLMSAFNRPAKLGVKAWGAMLWFWFLFHVFVFGSGCVLVFGSGYIYHQT